MLENALKCSIRSSPKCDLAVEGLKKRVLKRLLGKD